MAKPCKGRARDANDPRCRSPAQAGAHRAGRPDFRASPQGGPDVMAAAQVDRSQDPAARIATTIATTRFVRWSCASSGRDVSRDLELGRRSNLQPCPGHPETLAGLPQRRGAAKIS
jgi:hypothetical protein